MKLATIIPYIKIARFDHYIKQLFIVPGSVVAIFLCYIYPDIDIFMNILLAFVATSFIASANYVINEYLDAKFDKFHPIKSKRPLVTQNVKFKYIMLEYLVFLVLGLGLSTLMSVYIFALECLLAVMGVVYNVEPLRSKDVPYLDIISESFNMVIRLFIGWFVVTENFLPPLSLVMGYWLTGAYLMSVKRYSEYRMIANKTRAGLYRKSFQYYTEENLMIQSLFYAIISVFFIGIFLIKYRIELIIDIPFICILYCYYFKLSFAKDSSTQNPEKLFHEKALIAYIFFICVLSLSLLFIRIPVLQIFQSSSLIEI